MPYIAGRLLRLLSLLNAGHNWRGEDLADRFGVTPRTVRRDVDVPFSALEPPELRDRCAELSRRLGEAAAPAAGSGFRSPSSSAP